MKLQVWSDLHTEFWDGRELLTFRHLPIEKDLDFLVVAGDTVVPGYQGSVLVESIFAAISEMARHVLLVLGNHEYYRGSKAWTEAQIRTAIARWPNIHLLDNSEITLDERHFVGGVMWYPVGDGMNFAFARQMADAFEIQNFTWAERENAIFNNVVNALAGPETVVITHHLPHIGTVPQQHRGSNLNRFFVSDQSYTMKTRRPRLWLFGHTHTPCDVMYEATRLVCNPYGYPQERAGMGPYPAVTFDV